MRQIPELGDRAIFKCLTWINSSGGTSFDGREVLAARAKITKGWVDEETGIRYWAVLEEDVDVVDEFTGPERLRKGTVVFVGEFDVRQG